MEQIWKSFDGTCFWDKERCEEHEVSKALEEMDTLFPALKALTRLCRKRPTCVFCKIRRRGQCFFDTDSPIRELMEMYDEVARRPHFLQSEDE